MEATTNSIFYVSLIDTIILGSIPYIFFSICMSILFLIIKSVEYIFTKKIFHFWYYVKIWVITHILTYVCAIYGSWISVSQSTISNYYPFIPYTFVKIFIVWINVYIWFLYAKKHLSITKFEVILLFIFSTVCIIFWSSTIPYALLAFARNF